MSITGPGSITAANIAAQNNMMNQLNTLGEELGTGQVAQNYSQLGPQSGLAVALGEQLSDLSGYSNTASTVGTTLTIEQSVLGQLSSASSATAQTIEQQGGFALTNTGQTTTQAAAASYLNQIVAFLNTQIGGNYMFSGSAVNQPSVVNSNEILNGNGAQAGLTQLISERQQADAGTNGMGRLAVTVTGAGSNDVTVSQDGSPFGFQLASVTSNMTGVTVNQPSGSPPSLSVDLGSNPSDGQTVQFALTLPDGSSQTITLQATANPSPGANQFTIGSSASVTAGNLQTALQTSLTNLAQTALPAASAIAAANDFFEVPPQIVDPSSAPNYAAATSLVNGTSANTVMWYTGENGSTPALQTATADVAPSLTISYGMRATEPAITALLANVAAFAATTFSSSNPNAQASYQALSQSVITNLDNPSGQTIGDMQSDIANAQATVTNATTLNTHTQGSLQDMLQGIEGINENQIGENLLTLQNNLSASMAVTARLAQLSLVNYLGSVAG